MAGQAAGREPEAQVVDVGGRRLRLTHLDKVLYPATGTTKAEVLDYLVQASGPLLAQLADRPVTRIRWPHGTSPTGDADAEQRFFEKNVPRGAPSWLRTATLTGSGRRGDGDPDQTVTYPLFDDVAALVWAANLSALELHTPQWTVGRSSSSAPAVRGPDRLVVDLDPGPGTGLAECSELAVLVAERLADDGLEAVPVTSGGKGMQLYAPVSGRQEAAVVHAYAKRLAEQLARDVPWVTAVMTKALRRGKVLVDWSQNSPAKTTITPYSLRGRARPTVAAPRRWDELGESLAQLGPEEVLARLAEDGDLMAAAAGPGPSLRVP